MSKGPDWFGRSPGENIHAAAERLEDNACRTALRIVDINPIGVLRAAGCESKHRLKFDHLVDYTLFPIRIRVTGTEPDTITKLMYDFRKSNFWEAWVMQWDVYPTPPIKRFMVFRGDGNAPWVAYHAMPERPDRSHILVGHSERTLIILERFSQWCRTLSWDGGDFRNYGTGQFSNY